MCVSVGVCECVSECASECVSMFKCEYIRVYVSVGECICV